MNNKNLSAAILVLILLVGGFFIFRGLNSDSSDTTTSSLSGGGGDIQESSVSGNFVKGQAAPDFSFSDFEGNTHSLANYGGKPVVIDFWAAWCPFCVAEMPELERAHQQHGSELIIIGMHRTDTESPERGSDFAKDRGVTYLLGSDSGGALYRAAGGFGMPVAVLIDSSGVVVEVKSGPKTAEEIEEKTADLVGDANDAN